MRIEIWTDEREDMTNPIVAVRHFANGPKNKKSEWFTSDVVCYCVHLPVNTAFMKYNKAVCSTNGSAPSVPSSPSHLSGSK